MNKRTAIAQRLVREGRIRAASPRVGHIDAAAASRRVGIRVSESYCVSPNTKQKLVKKYKIN